MATGEISKKSCDQTAHILCQRRRNDLTIAKAPSPASLQFEISRIDLYEHTRWQKLMEAGLLPFPLSKILRANHTTL
jgi:hypothetical protein